MTAARQGRPECARLLLKWGADPNQPNQHGVTPWEVASELSTAVARAMEELHTGVPETPSTPALGVGTAAERGGDGGGGMRRAILARKALSSSRESNAA